MAEETNLSKCMTYKNTVKDEETSLVLRMGLSSVALTKTIDLPPYSSKILVVYNDGGAFANYFYLKSLQNGNNWQRIH